MSSDTLFDQLLTDLVFWVFHLFAENEDHRVMAPGMIFTVGPILVALSPQCDVWPDGYTTATLDHHASAQFRDTILITESGREVLTTPD